MGVNGQHYDPAVLLPTKEPRCPLNRGLCGPQNPSGRFGEAKNLRYVHIFDLREIRLVPGLPERNSWVSRGVCVLTKRGEGGKFIVFLHSFTTLQCIEAGVEGFKDCRTIWTRTTKLLEQWWKILPT